MLFLTTTNNLVSFNLAFKWPSLTNNPQLRPGHQTSTGPLQDSIFQLNDELESSRGLQLEMVNLNFVFNALQRDSPDWGRMGCFREVSSCFNHHSIWSEFNRPTYSCRTHCRSTISTVVHQLMMSMCISESLHEAAMCIQSMVQYALNRTCKALEHPVCH